MSTDYSHIADFLTEGIPLAFAHRFDGSLSVVAANGQKFIFSPDEVIAAKKALQSASKSSPAPKKAPKTPKNT